MECFVCKKEITPMLVLAGNEDIPDLLRCPSCDVGFVYPQPDDSELTSYYMGMYSGFACEFDQVKMLWAKNSVAVYAKEAGIILQDKTVLDLGGGLGYYTKAFQEGGAHATLVESDPVSAEFARRILEVREVFEENIHSFLCTNKNKYDVVFLRHVIEHCKDPHETVNLITKILKPNGVFIIETDNNAGVEILFRPGTLHHYYSLYKSSYSVASPLCLFVKRPFTLDPPRHLFGFRMKSLELLLEKNCLRTFKRVHYRLGHPVYWPNMPLPSWDSPLKNILRLCFRRASVEAIDLALNPIRLVLEKVGLSSGICIYARKKDSVE